MLSPPYPDRSGKHRLPGQFRTRNNTMNSTLFTPATIGPVKLRNRTIRSAGFEGMCPGGTPGESLINYHRSVAAGG